MATDVSIRVGVDGEKEFRTALNGINSQIKNLNSEMKTIVTSMTGMDNAEEKAAKQTDVLGRKMDVTKQKISTLSAEYDRQKAKLAQLGTELDQLKAAQDKDEQAITKATNAYNRQQQTVNKLGTQLNDATSDMNKMEQEMLDIVHRADDASDALDDVGKQAADFGDVLKANLLGNAISNGLNMLSDGLKSAFSAGMGYNSTIETYTTSFEVMTGSAEKAAETVEKLSEIAATTPFEMPDLANVAQLLMNYGFTAEEAIDRMTMLGDISQGNAEKMQSIATAYGQMSSAGKVQLEDIKQMIENGFNPLQEISESTGESMASLYDRISDGTVAVDEITQSMKRATSEGGRYFHSMEKQSQTFNGQLSTLQDNVNSALGETFSGVTDTLTNRVLPALNDAISEIDFSGIGEEIGDAFNWLLNNGDTIVSVTGKIASGLAGIGIVAGGLQIKNIATDLMGVADAAIAGSQALATYETTTKAASIAQGALSAVMSVTPLGALTIGLGSLLAGMAVYVNTTDTAVTESERMAEALNELSEKSNEYQQAQAQIAERRDEQLASSESELAHAQEMIAELQLLTDANGQVVAGEEARAETLANLINEIIPGAVEWTNQQSGAYANLASNLDMLIEKERLNALIMANQEAYQAAVQNQQAYMDGMIEAAQNVDYYTQRVEELKAAIASGVYEGDPWGDLGEAQQALDQYSQELENFKNLYSDSSNTIMQQEALMAAAASNDYATMQEALASYGSSLTQFTGSNQAELQQQAADMQAAYDTMLALSQEYPGLITDAQLAEAQSRAQQAKQIAEQAGQEEAQAQASGLQSGQSDINAAGEANAKSGAEVASSQTSAFNTAGVNAGVGYASGIRSQGGAARSAGAYLANQATAGLNSAQQSHSPSRVTMKSGEWFTQGYENGIAKGKNALLRGVSVMVAGAIGILDKGGNTAEDVAIRTSRKLGDALLDEQDKLNKQLAELEQRERDRQAEEELADYEEKIKKKYEELEKAETSERKKIQDEIARMEEEWRDEQLKEQLDAQLDVLEEFTKQYEDALEEIQNKQDDMADKLRDYGDLFETVKTETGEFLELGDIEEDIAAIERYGEALDQLKERGISGSLMDEILDMDIDDALAYTDELLTMTDDQYDSYMALWEQKQEEAQKIAKKFYQDEMDALQDEFVDKIPDELGHVKDEMRTIGVDGIQGMIDGMYSRSGALWSAASSIVSQAIAAMRAEADIHSPSKKVAEKVGIPMGEGVAVGMLQGIKESRRAIDEAIMSPINQVSADDIYNAAAGAVNGITAAGSASGTQTIIIPVNLNGKQIAEVIYDPLRQVGKQRGVAFG